MGVQATELFHDAQKILKKLIENKSLTAKAIFGLFPANAVEDDIFLQNAQGEDIGKFITLRQQAKNPKEKSIWPWQILLRQEKQEFRIM